MPNPIISAVGSAVGGAMQASAQTKAANKAADAQTAAADASIAEQRRQFDQVNAILKPYVDTGAVGISGTLALLGYGGSATPQSVQQSLTGAMGGGQPLQIETIRGTPGGVNQQAIRQAKARLDSIGGSRNQQAYQAALRGTAGTPDSYRVGGQTFRSLAEAQAFAQSQGMTAGATPAGVQGGMPDQFGMTPQQAQLDAIKRIENGSMFGELTRQGEDAILANAAATGGLRGGNVQGVLAQYRPQMLQGLIDRQLAALGGLSANGQNAAGNLGTASMTTGANIGNAFSERGAAQAGGALAQGRATSGFLTGLGTTAGDLAASWKDRPAGAGTFQAWGF
jgi:hypothetical protein